MPDVGTIIRARRRDLGIDAAELAVRVGTTATQISRWENGRQEPTASNCRALARALVMSTDELVGLIPVGLDLSGTYFAEWDTSRDGVSVIDRHTIEAKHRGDRFSFSATGDYLWSGDLRVIDGVMMGMMGTYLSSERDKMYRGALYFTLSEDLDAAIGRWTGLWADGLVGGGWGVLARSSERASRLMKLVMEHDGPLTEWPSEE